MKTQQILSAAFMMLFSIATIASAPKSVFTMNDSFGRSLNMPVANEEEIGDFNFDSQAVFHQIMLENVESNIDLTDMIKPEGEVRDIPTQVRSNIDITDMIKPEEEVRDIPSGLMAIGIGIK